MANEPVRVTIVVVGGVVQDVYAGNFVEVVVLDFDNAEDDEGYTPGVFPAELQGEMPPEIEEADRNARDPECGTPLAETVRKHDAQDRKAREYMRALGATT